MPTLPKTRRLSNRKLFELLGKETYQELTEKERACVSRKISKLKGEGKKASQAIAIAIRTCAPGKARTSKDSAGSQERRKEPRRKKDTRPSYDKDGKGLSNRFELPGGRYTAVQNSDDGTWNIIDVPIFCAHVLPEGPDGKKRAINRKWMEAALKRHARRFAEDGYIPPLHINHHAGPFGGDEVKKVGFFRLRKVATFQYEGKPVSTMFADLIRIPNWAFELIEAGELPYRSVEIIDLEAKEIDSLSLLEHHVPFFRLPLLTIGKKVSATKARELMAGSPAMAYRGAHWPNAEHDGAFILFKFEEDEMGNPMKDDVDLLYADEDEEEENDENAQEEGEDDEPAGELPEEEQEEIGEMLGKAIAMMQQGMEALAQVSTMVGDKAAEAAEEVAEDGETVDDEEPSGPAEAKAKTDNATLLGRVLALEQRDRERNKREKVERLITYAKKQLKGYAISRNDWTEIRRMATEGGKRSVDVLVKQIKKYGIPDPPEEDYREFAGVREEPSDSNAVQKIGNDYGPNALAQARRYSKEWKRMGNDVEVSEEDYLMDNLLADGVIKRKRK